MGLSLLVATERGEREEGRETERGTEREEAGEYFLIVFLYPIPMQTNHHGGPLHSGAH